MFLGFAIDPRPRDKETTVRGGLTLHPPQDFAIPTRRGSWDIYRRKRAEALAMAIEWFRTHLVRGSASPAP